MPEELTLNQMFRDGGAVDGDKWFILLRTGEMDGTGHQFLAGSRLSTDQDISFGRCDLFDDLIDSYHGRAFADQVVKPETFFKFLAQSQVFTLQL